MKEKTIQLLNEADDYISGEEISKQLGVSRTAIWKVINRLKEEGYEIESVTRKGYRLLSSPDILNSEELHYNLNTEIIGNKIINFDKLDSTNQQAKKLALEGASNGTVIIAEEQTAGKGRRGKMWVSPPGTGIWMSVVLRPSVMPENASMLTLVAGLAVCKAVREITNLEASIKWPNDIVVNGKKICGLLTEMNSEIDFINFVVVGIGINVNIEKFPPELDNIATSLMIEGNQSYQRKKLVKRTLEIFEGYYKKYLETEDLTKIIEEYNEHCINIGRKVRVTGRKQDITGNVKCVTNKGELIVTDQQGEDIVVTSGEVSVRGIYGYV
ncbi:biotin--[acetyl-CoA-carboxylase] ligase [Vallitalea sp.]|jgi:BirA family biotin operon repressor/biotin-[acetyl-CoA-carboxylase] ligase|uniref:biotin--[acetyl-CoA-carboxylase] ligase n=1 Tax=Vallitalea sp. TaxID=1882829 RepID=UPI0025E74198|nr:biotin--[acetyl-CoA-carboxylase] ligase [Vallitalea sp.]MCT4686468.1 biotin--[acetyl-CoA-carboxylase] ligase [Vallitalea sp.]